MSPPDQFRLIGIPLSPPSLRTGGLATERGAAGRAGSNSCSVLSAPNFSECFRERPSPSKRVKKKHYLMSEYILYLKQRMFLLFLSDRSEERQALTFKHSWHHRISRKGDFALFNLQRRFGKTLDRLIKCTLWLETRVAWTWGELCRWWAFESHLAKGLEMSILRRKIMAPSIT